MSTENALEIQIETALASWLANTGTHGVTAMSAFNIRKEQQDGSDNLTLPAIVLKCEREEEDPAPGAGVWRCKVDVTLHSQADDTTTAALLQQWNDVVRVVYRDDLASKLAIASTLTTYAVRFDSPTGRAENERHFNNTLTFHCWSYSV